MQSTLTSDQFVEQLKIDLDHFFTNGTKKVNHCYRHKDVDVMICMVWASKMVVSPFEISLPMEFNHKIYVSPDNDDLKELIKKAFSSVHENEGIFHSSTLGGQHIDIVFYKTIEFFLKNTTQSNPKKNTGSCNLF